MGGRINRRVRVNGKRVEGKEINYLFGLRRRRMEVGEQSWAGNWEKVWAQQIGSGKLFFLATD